MNTRKRAQSFLLFGLSVVAMLLLVSGMPGLRLRPGEPLHLIDWFFAQLDAADLQDSAELAPQTEEDLINPDFWSRLGDRMLSGFILLFWAMLIFSIVFAIVSPQFRRELLRLFGMILPLIILLPYLAERMAQQVGLEEVEIAGEFSLDEIVYPQPPPFVQDPPEWLFIAVDVLLLLLLFGIIFYLWRRFRPKPDAQAVLVREVRRALTQLESGEKLRDVVIECYAEMCQGLEKSRQIKRHRTMTPREFEQHLAEAGIASSHIAQLTQLFERVRYGAESTDQAMQQQAKYALQAILETYGD